MKRALCVTMMLALTAGVASAQFAAKDAAEAWADAPMFMAGIQTQPEISQVVLVNLACDRARADHVALATRIPDALAEYLLKQDLAKQTSRRDRTFELEELGLPKFDSRDEVAKFAEEAQADAMVCGDVSLVGDATRVRLVLAELDQFAFYPPINVYFTDPNAVEPVVEMTCRAMRSFLKAQDLQQELADAWKAPGDGTVRFEARPNLSRVPADQPATLFVRFEFAAGRFEVTDRSPLNVALVLDRSGSMEGDKIEQARQAAIRVVEGLEKDDRISLVIYHHEVEAPIPNRSAAERERIIELIKGIEADGYTNLGGGLQRGYELARKAPKMDYVNRAILISDGLANRGETDPAVLARWARDQYVRDLPTSTIGIGTDYDANLMEKIAVSGNGGYYYVETPESINDIIAREFSSLFATVAEGSRLTVRPAAGVTLEKIIGFEVQEKDGEQRVDVPTLRSSDRKFLIAKLRVPALAEGAHEVLRARVDYQDALRDGKPAQVETTLSIAAGGAAGADAVNWDVQLDAEELATTDTMDEVVKRLDADDREGAIALLQGRILELAGMSLMTLDLRSQVQCNILDGLIALIRQGTDPDRLRYARLNAQSISYGGLAANTNYQGLGQMRGDVRQLSAGAGAPAPAKLGFGGKRQQ
ncbi:MAG: VWA domain-containing protein [Armatimonadetes bacterium]|nr:VWA domain-containing protein [Armatimonadota bacterium]